MAGGGDMNDGIRAVRRLAKLGYRTWVEGEVIKFRFEGQKDPDPEQIKPLFQLIREHKDEVMYFLRCYCPKCGGVFFWSDGGGPWGKKYCYNCEPPENRVLH
jgi:hypothetical protein